MSCLPWGMKNYPAVVLRLDKINILYYIASVNNN